MGCYNQYKLKQEAAHTQSARISTCYTLWHFGDWSLIRGGGAKKWQVGQVNFYPYKRGESGFFLVVLKGGGHNKF